jgi:glycosyltransferase involved in cell wall biosynthesis
MRVLRINDWTGPPGGTEAYLTSLCRALEAQHHPQKLVSITDAAQVSDYRPQPWEEILPLAPMGARRLTQDLGRAPKVFDRLSTVVEEFRPDLVHLHHFDSLFTPMAKFLQGLKVPLVMTAHDAKLVCPIATLVLPDGKLCEGGILPRCQLTGCEVGWGLPYKLEQDRVFRKKVAPLIRLFIAPSRAAAGFLERHHFRPTRVIHPFIDVPPEVVNAPPPWSSGPPTVGFLGRLETYKGGATLLAAVAQARRDLPDLHLVLAGRGPALDAWRSEARSLGLQEGRDVEFPGWVEGPAKEAFFARLHLLAVPSEGYENFGLIGLEAMVRARPCLGSDLGGIPDWLEDGKVGKLVRPADVGAWRGALIDAFRDPDRLRQWGATARALYEARFEPFHHLEALLPAYHDVLEGTAGPTSSAPSARAGA